MRRTDRLFELILLFRGGRLRRGRDLAERLGVSLRTVYRDIDTLVASGLPIEGERGVGYVLREPVFLPPLTLSFAELEALHLGMEVVKGAADADLAEAARCLLDKIDAVLPSDRRGVDPLRGLSVYMPTAPEAVRHRTTIRRAVVGRRILDIAYTRLDGTETRRRVRPLHIEYWGQTWTLTAWCDLRNAFRVFRIDRIAACDEVGEAFPVEADKSYAAYLAGLEGYGADDAAPRR